MLHKQPRNTGIEYMLAPNKVTTGRESFLKLIIQAHPENQLIVLPLNKSCPELALSKMKMIRKFWMMTKKLTCYLELLE